MGDKSAIQWTDATWSPTVGCSVLSPGCSNCYAMKLAARLERMGSEKYVGLTQASKAGPVWNGLVRLDQGALTLPLRWRRPRRIFVNSMSDLFHEDLPDEAIDRVFAVMALAPQHTFQVLTKRARRMRDYLWSDRRFEISCAIDEIVPRRTDESLAAKDRVARETAPGVMAPLEYVWLGVSVEDQKRADERIPDLLATPAAVRFLSCEPLLGPVAAAWPRCDCTQHSPTLDALNASIYCEGCCEGPEAMSCGRIDWVIVGGESGPAARPHDLAWDRALRDQCARAGVAFYEKQLGARPVIDGIPLRLKNRKGDDWDEWPEDLRVREFPERPS